MFDLAYALRMSPESILALPIARIGEYADQVIRRVTIQEEAAKRK